jgi:hypothetical protein
MLAGRVLAPISGIASAITRATQTFTSLRSINRLMLLERERHPTRSYLARQIRHSAGHAGLRSEILVWSGRAGGNAARGYRVNKSRRDQGDFQSGLRSSISRRAGLSADNRHA